MPSGTQEFPPALVAHYSAERSLATWQHRRDLLRELIARDMKLRYRGSFFGMAWTLLNPLTELLVLLFIFNVVLPLNIPRFGAFLFTGLLVYGWFQSALIYATTSIVANRELIRRPDVPPAILPAVTVASTLLHFLLSLPVLMVFLIATGVQLTGALAALPALMTVQFILTLALAYPLASLHVWFRDTQYFLRVALQLLFYLTPIFYQPSSIPERFRRLYAVNPMMWIVEGYRDVLLRGVIPSLGAWAALATVSTVLLCAGLAIFMSVSYRFADEL
jgi:lipopolysaccharide transport system permease protein